MRIDLSLRYISDIGLNLYKYTRQKTFIKKFYVISIEP